jgi:ElaB/YqjD/DUF883 family membrane-anchored ribosome-binding protein
MPWRKIMSEVLDASKDKLIADFKIVVADAEELLRATAGQAGEKVTAARGRVEENLVRARQSLAEAQVVVVDKAKAVGRVTDDYVQDNPWRSVGIAAGFGFIVGLLIGRR